jgi:hypothetical protein
MKGLEISLIWQDPNIEELHVKISNGMNFCELNLYDQLESLSKFGKKLQEFPKTINEKISLEIGSINHAYLFIEAMCYNQFGHAALKVHAVNNTDIPLMYDTTFYISCEVASINELGSQLASWNPKNDYYLEWYPKM